MFREERMFVDIHITEYVMIVFSYANYKHMSKVVMV